MLSQPTDRSANTTKRTLRIVFLTLFIDLVGFSIIFPLFPAMLDGYLPNGPNDGSLLGRLMAPLFQWAERSGTANPKFMTSVLFGGILSSLYSVLQFLCAPFWGAYSDRVGRRKVLLITISGLALSYVVWFFAASFWMLVLSRIIGGIMGCNFSVATAAIADVTSRKERSGYMAIVGIASGLGFIIGPAIGGLSSVIDLTEIAPKLTRIGINPFSVPAAISLMISALNLIWVYYAYRETLPLLRNREAAVSSPASLQFHTNRSDIQTKPPLTVEKPGSSFFGLFQSPVAAIRCTNLTYLFFMLAFSGVQFTLTFLAVERFGFTPAQNGFVFIFSGLVLIFTQGSLVRYMSGKGREKILSTTGLIMSVFASLLLASSLSIGAFFGALALMSLSMGFVVPTLSSLISLYAREDEQGHVLGMFRSGGFLARTVGPLLAAFIYFSYGSTSTYLFGGIVMTVSVIFSLSLPRNLEN